MTKRIVEMTVGIYCKSKDQLLAFSPELPPEGEMLQRIGELAAVMKLPVDDLEWVRLPPGTKVELDAPDDPQSDDLKALNKISDFNKGTPP